LNSEPPIGLWQLWSLAWICNECSIRCLVVLGKPSSCMTARTTLTWKLLNLPAGRLEHPNRNYTKHASDFAGYLGAGQQKHPAPQRCAVAAEGGGQNRVSSQTLLSVRESWAGRAHDSGSRSTTKCQQKVSCPGGFEPSASESATECDHEQCVRFYPANTSSIW
jgi:hypothetical protein